MLVLSASWDTFYGHIFGEEAKSVLAGWNGRAEELAGHFSLIIFRSSLRQNSVVENRKSGPVTFFGGGNV